MNAQYQIPAIQFSFDDYLAKRAKEEAITRVEEHANSDWKTYALSTVQRVARQCAEFSTDAVLEAMQNAPVATHELRALGPVMLSAVKAGYIQPTDRFVNCKRASRHKAPVRVWQSLIYRS